MEVVGRRFSGRMRLGVEHCCFSIQSAWWKDMTSHKSCATLAYFEPAEVTSWPKLHICHEGNKHARPSDPILPQRKRKEKGETCTTNMYPLQPLPHSCSPIAKPHFPNAPVAVLGIPENTSASQVSSLHRNQGDLGSAQSHHRATCTVVACCTYQIISGPLIEWLLFPMPLWQLQVAMLHISLKLTYWSFFRC